MRRLLLVMSVAALMAAMLVASALPAFAQASEDASCAGQEFSDLGTSSPGFLGNAFSTGAQTAPPGDLGLAVSLTAQAPRNACEQPL
jgi:hypothetical protein